MSMSYLPRRKFTDSCGQPRAPKTIHVGGCGPIMCRATTERGGRFFETGIAIAGAAGFGMILDPREVLGQGRVFPPPPRSMLPTNVTNSRKISFMAGNHRGILNEDPGNPSPYDVRFWPRTQSISTGYVKKTDLLCMCPIKRQPPAYQTLRANSQSLGEDPQ